MWETRVFAGFPPREAKEKLHIKREFDDLYVPPQNRGKVAYKEGI